MKKRVACIPVHFGKEYLAWAVRGMQEAVDEVHIFHAPEPSYGYRVEGAVCPDSREELEAEARRFATTPLFWHTVTGTNDEHIHRMVMHDTVKARGAEVYLLADADEVWDVETAKQAIEYVHNANSAGRWLVNFCHFWRSFKWTVADAFRPIRIVDTRRPLDQDAHLPKEAQPWPVFHFGYAQTLQTMRYKLTCHSHSTELRPEWLEERFIPWRPGAEDVDLHPVMKGNFWTVRPPSDEIIDHLGKILGDHPHYSKELIE